MALLQVEHVKKYFATQKAVDDVSFSIEPGTIFGMLGPNGAGKTTLLRMITGIILPDSGNILFEGKPFDWMKNTQEIGYMPEERGLYKKMSIGEQAIYLSRLKGMNAREAEKAVKEWFIKFGMESWWTKKVSDLSKGMSQKLQFVTTVAHNPRLIILDEPFSGLDPVNANLIKDEIFNLAHKGATIIFSTHRMEQVEEICDKIVLINQGKNILEGTIKDVKNDFKENVYKIELNNQVGTLPENDLYSVIHQNENQILIQMKNGASSNAVLQQLINSGNEIHHFSEMLPTLNQIFIKLVEGTSAARQFIKQ